MSVRHVLVVLTDDAGHRALPVRLSGRDGGFWRLLARPGDRDEVVPEDYAEEMTGQLLDAAGITVTAVTVTELGPGVTATRIDIAVPGGTRQVTTRLADGLALAVITGAPLAVDGPVMDRLAEPVTGPDLLSPFRSRQQEDPEPGPLFEPRNLAFTDGLRWWRLVGPRLRPVTGLDYSCTTEDGRAILTAAVPEPTAFAFLCQEIYADDYHDRTVTFRGDLRTTDVAGRAGLLLRVTSRIGPRHGEPAGQDPANHFAFVTGTGDWTHHEVTVQIPPDANYIFFGVFLNGRGQIELRNPELEPHPADSRDAAKTKTKLEPRRVSKVPAGDRRAARLPVDEGLDGGGDGTELAGQEHARPRARRDTPQPQRAETAIMRAAHRQQAEMQLCILGVSCESSGYEASGAFTFGNDHFHVQGAAGAGCGRRQASGARSAVRLACRCPVSAGACRYQLARTRVPFPARRDWPTWWPQGAGELRAGELRTGEVRADQIGIGEVGAGEVRASQTRAG